MSKANTARLFCLTTVQNPGTDCFTVAAPDQETAIIIAAARHGLDTSTLCLDGKRQNCQTAHELGQAARSGNHRLPRFPARDPEFMALFHSEPEPRFIGLGECWLGGWDYEDANSQGDRS